MLEWVFAAYLVVYFPLRQLWRSLRPAKDKPAAEAASVRYLRSVRFILTLLAVMVALMLYYGRTAADIGLDFPVSRYGQWGLGFCAVLIAISVIWPALPSSKGEDEQATAEMVAKVEALPIIPRSPRDFGMFLLMSICVGAGWELLYRGYLMLVLPGLLGTAGAVIATAVAYGAGHGYENPRQFIGSIISAFLFTLAYVFTHSLWWLIVVHLMAPLFMGIMGYRVLKKAGKLNESAA